MIKKGVLLLNLGTPDNDDAKSVYRYLTEFLNDSRVIDLPNLIRWVLVNLIIIPFRYRKSAEAYHKIWKSTGSPLLQHSLALKNSLQAVLEPQFQIEIGMRYGRPSIASALKKLEGCSQISILPLFPQYSSAATGSAIQKTLEILSSQWNIPELFIMRDFYQQPGFIAAYTAIIREKIAHKNIDQLILSYHGLPERHIVKSHCQAKCDRIQACPPINHENLFCYRAQCFATSNLLAQQLKLEPTQYMTTFQSRLGRTPWIKPYTDLILPQLIAKGMKNIAIACPSFVADCLETLEEINIRAREQWQSLGGHEFTFIPCLNNHPLWVNALKDMLVKGFLLPTHL